MMVNQDSTLQSQQSCSSAVPERALRSLERAKPVWVLRLNGTQERICFADPPFAPSIPSLYCTEAKSGNEVNMYTSCYRTGIKTTIHIGNADEKNTISWISVVFLSFSYTANLL
jgi:hypothetical protein